MKTKMTATTPLGTFTRTTDRTYTHVVVSLVRQVEGVITGRTVCEWCGSLDLAAKKAAANRGQRRHQDSDYPKHGGKPRRATGELIFESAEIFPVDSTESTPAPKVEPVPMPYEAEIGKLMRNGRPIYYATVNGIRTEREYRAELVLYMDAALKAGGSVGHQGVR